MNVEEQNTLFPLIFRMLGNKSKENRNIVISIIPRTPIFKWVGVNPFSIKDIVSVFKALLTELYKKRKDVCMYVGIFFILPMSIRMKVLS